jgi:hypothetical protein
VLLALPRLFDVLLDVLYQLRAHRRLVVARNVHLYRVDYLLVRHVAQQLLLVKSLEVGQQLHRQLVLPPAHFSRNYILPLPSSVEFLSFPVETAENLLEFFGLWQFVLALGLDFDLIVVEVEHDLALHLFHEDCLVGFQPLAALVDAEHSGERRFEELLLEDDGNDGVRVVEGARQQTHQQVDGERQQILVLADYAYCLLQHHHAVDLIKRLFVEYSEGAVGPIPHQTLHQIATLQAEVQVLSSEVEGQFGSLIDLELVQEGGYFLENMVKLFGHIPDIQLGIILALLGLFFHAFDFDLVDDPDEQLAEEVDEGEVAEDAKVEAALEDAGFAIHAAFLSDCVRHNYVFLSMKFLDFILADAETAVDSVLVGLVRKNVIAELQADAVEGLEGVELLGQLVLGILVVGVALEEDEDTAVLLLEALAEEDLVDVHVLLLLPHHFEPHAFWIQIVPVCLETAVSVWEIQLVRYFLVLFYVPHLIQVRPEKTDVLDERVGLESVFGNFN